MADQVNATVITERTSTRNLPAQGVPREWVDQIYAQAGPLAEQLRAAGIIAPPAGMTPNGMTIREHVRDFPNGAVPNAANNPGRDRNVRIELRYPNGDTMMLEGFRAQTANASDNVFYNRIGFSNMTIRKADGREVRLQANDGDWNQALVLGPKGPDGKDREAERSLNGVGDVFENIMSTTRDALDKGVTGPTVPGTTLNRSVTTRTITSAPMPEAEKQAILRASRFQPGQIDDIKLTRVIGEERIDNGTFVQLTGPAGILNASQYNLEGLRNGRDRGIQTSGTYNRELHVSGGITAAHAHHTTGGEWRGVQLWQNNQPNGFGPVNRPLTTTIVDVLKAAGVDPKTLPNPLDANAPREPQLDRRRTGPALPP